jgi:hypothetical protein
MFVRIPAIPTSWAREGTISMSGAGSLYFEVYFPLHSGDFGLRIKAATVVKARPIVVEPEDCHDHVDNHEEDGQLDETRDGGHQRVNLLADARKRVDTLERPEDSDCAQGLKT